MNATEERIGSGGGNAERVGIVVVNWNSFDVLNRCLAAIKTQSFAPACVVVVDNGSDSALVDLQGELPDNTIYIRLSDNTGFAHANNLAVARLGECEWIALINPDAFPEPDWLEQLVSATRRRPEYAFFASLTIADEFPSHLDGTGDVYHVSGIAWRRGYGRRTAETRLLEEEVFAPCAAAALYRRDAWDDAGGFDENYFCYFEDVDLAFRLRLLGYRCLFVPTAVARHIGSVTSGGQQSDFSVYYGHRNLVWTYIKNMPGYAFWLFLPLHMALNLATLLWFSGAGRWRVIFKAKWDALKGLKKAWIRRREIQLTRRVPVQAIIGRMDKRLIPFRKHGQVARGQSPYMAPLTSILSCGGAGKRTVDNTDEGYFNYLRSRSVLGLLYRRYWLYPRLVRVLRGRVLDVGCGIGDFLKFRPETVGADINRYVIESCCRRGLDARLMTADVLPFPDDSFDCVVMDNVLEHIYEPRPLLGEITRVLRPNGCLLIGVPGLRGYACDSDHKVFYAEDSLDELMRHSGYSKDKTFYTPVKSEWLDRVLPQYCLYGVYTRPGR